MVGAWLVQCPCRGWWWNQEAVITSYHPDRYKTLLLLPSLLISFSLAFIGILFLLVIFRSEDHLSPLISAAAMQNIFTCLLLLHQCFLLPPLNPLSHHCCRWEIRNQSFEKLFLEKLHHLNKFLFKAPVELHLPLKFWQRIPGIHSAWIRGWFLEPAFYSASIVKLHRDPAEGSVWYGWMQLSVGSPFQSPKEFFKAAEPCCPVGSSPDRASICTCRLWCLEHPLPQKETWCMGWGGVMNTLDYKILFPLKGCSQRTKVLNLSSSICWLDNYV